MPALVNKSVGSFFITTGADGTIVWPLDLKKSRNCCRISALVVILKLFIWVDFCCVSGYICSGGKGKEKAPPILPPGEGNEGDVSEEAKHD